MQGLRRALADDLSVCHCMYERLKKHEPVRSAQSTVVALL